MIFFDQFCVILRNFGIQLTELEKESILESFPGRDEGLKKRINISRLYD